MPDYQKMTDAEFYVECADVVHHLCTKLMIVTRQTAGIARSDSEAVQSMITPALEFSMAPMIEGLDNIVNALDIVEESDVWIDEIYEELHRRLPASDSIDPAGDEAASGGEADL